MQVMMDNPDRWYSTKEICAYLGISRETLLTWIRETLINVSLAKIFKK